MRAELADVGVEALGHLRRHGGRRDLEVDVADAVPARERDDELGGAGSVSSTAIANAPGARRDTL